MSEKGPEMEKVAQQETAKKIVAEKTKEIITKIRDEFESRAGKKDEVLSPELIEGLNADIVALESLLSEILNSRLQEVLEKDPDAVLHRNPQESPAYRQYQMEELVVGLEFEGGCFTGDVFGTGEVIDTEHLVRYIANAMGEDIERLREEFDKDPSRLKELENLALLARVKAAHSLEETSPDCGHRAKVFSAEEELRNRGVEF